MGAAARGQGICALKVPIPYTAWVGVALSRAAGNADLPPEPLAPSTLDEVGAAGFWQGTSQERGQRAITPTGVDVRGKPRVDALAAHGTDTPPRCHA